MRKHPIGLAALALGACLALTAFNVDATPVSINLQPATGQHSYTSDGVTFSGWEFSFGTYLWEPAKMTYKANGPNETGLGVRCTYSTGDKCGQHEINTIPYQNLVMNLTGLKFGSMTVTVGSVDNGGCGDIANCTNHNETAYLYLAKCASQFAGQPFNSCYTAGPGLIILDKYRYNGTDRTASFTFDRAALQGFNYIWVSPIDTLDPSNAPDGNILLSSVSYTAAVPEPAELGMFGFGVLMIGLFAGSRRRMY